MKKEEHAKLVKKDVDELKLKVTKRVKPHEILECEGSFFYIESQEIKDWKGREYKRYYLKTIVSKKKIDLMKRILGIEDNKTKSKEGNNK